MIQEPFFSRQAAPVTAEFAAAVDDPVIRHDERQRIGTVRPRHGPDCLEVANTGGNFTIRAYFTLCDGFQCLPNRLLKGCPQKGNRRLKTRRRPRKIVAEFSLNLTERRGFTRQDDPLSLFTELFKLALQASPVGELEQVELRVVGNGEHGS